MQVDYALCLWRVLTLAFWILIVLIYSCIILLFKKIKTERKSWPNGKMGLT